MRRMLVWQQLPKELHCCLQRAGPVARARGPGPAPAQVSERANIQSQQLRGPRFPRPGARGPGPGPRVQGLGLGPGSRWGPGSGGPDPGPETRGPGPGPMARARTRGPGPRPSSESWNLSRYWSHRTPPPQTPKSTLRTSERSNPTLVSQIRPPRKSNCF